ncbi:hypothetical protein D7316_00029 [Gordonia insulae]|uniref:Uncharacterized protein n=1 Tax=Gordonia insulae TaxID=2420509 RepID=A0A3G8JFT8_9ACTN|nr:hypothetical protein D7316_00029 [Gordonia insulae]
MSELCTGTARSPLRSLPQGATGTEGTVQGPKTFRTVPVLTSAYTPKGTAGTEISKSFLYAKNESATRGISKSKHRKNATGVTMHNFGPCGPCRVSYPQATEAI